MTQTTNGHGGGAGTPDRPTGESSSTGYTWARRSELAPPAPAASGSDTSSQAPSAPTQGIPSGYPASGAPPQAATAGQGYGPSGTPPSRPANPPYSSTTTMPIPSHNTTPGGGQGGNSFAPPSTPHQREKRRPGWGGVVAMGAGAAVLSSLLTVGVLKATDDQTLAGTGTATTSQGSSPQVKLPVTSSSESNPDWTAVASAVEPSIVAVTVATQQAEGEGSGVILDKEGRIVTNNHVVSGAGQGASVKVTLSDGRTYDASVVGTDAATDLAVIKISNPPSDLTPATLGSSCCQ